MIHALVLLYLYYLILTIIELIKLRYVGKIHPSDWAYGPATGSASYTIPAGCYVPLQVKRLFANLGNL
jgi:hypothetical protein